MRISVYREEAEAGEGGTSAQVPQLAGDGPGVPVAPCMAPKATVQPTHAAGMNGLRLGFYEQGDWLMLGRSVMFLLHTCSLSETELLSSPELGTSGDRDSDMAWLLLSRHSRLVRGRDLFRAVELATVRVKYNKSPGVVVEAKAQDLHPSCVRYSMK